MKIIYDQETDTMTVIFKESTVDESDEAKSGIIIDQLIHGHPHRFGKFYQGGGTMFVVNSFHLR